MKSKFVKISLAVALAALSVPMFGRTVGAKGDLADKVRHELVMLPYYSVFDDFQFTVDNGTVTLAGDVTRPVLKSDAANVVQRIAGGSQQLTAEEPSSRNSVARIGRRSISIGGQFAFRLH